MNEWREVQLGELVRCQSGFAFKSRDWTTAGVPVVKIRDVRSGAVRLDGGSFVASDTAAAAERFLLSRGDVLITMSGEIGSVGVYKHDRSALLNQRVGRFELLNSSAADLNFLTFALQDPTQKQYFESVAYGVAQPNISPSLIGRARVRIPSLATQRRIAAVLSAFDELIEINERRIELLEDLARSLYREWFVHFRFPGHEDGEFVGSELGRIPQGWEVRQLADVLSLDKGLSYKGSYLTGSGQPMANLKCFAPRGGFRRLGIKPYSGDYRERHSVVSGDLIVANTDLTQAGHVIGSPAIVPRRDFSDGGLISHHLFAVRPLRGREDVPFLFQLMLDGRFRDFARARASGTTVLGLRAYDLIKYPFVAPPASIQARFSEVTRLAMEEADALVDQSETLAATRDLLLPRLVTGRLDISDVDLGDLLPAGAQ